MASSEDMSLSEWLEAAKENQFHIYIESSEIVTSSMIGKGITLYKIHWSDSQEASGSLSRRYSEFETLHQVLTARYRDFGILIPPLPPKYLTISDAELINSRKRGLTLFCQTVANNPYIRYDSLWEAFLQPSCDLKEFMKQSENENNAKNVGYSRLLQALQQTEMPVDISRLISHVRTETTNFERPLKQLCEASKTFGTALIEYSNGLNTFSVGVQSLVDFEKTEITALNGIDEETRNSNAGTQSVPNVFSYLARLVGAQREAFKDYPILNAMLVTEVVEFEIMRINELRAMVKYREDFVDAISKNETKLRQIEENKKSKIEQVQEQRQVVDQKKMACNQFTKGLFFISLPNIIDSRNKLIRWMTAHICAIQFAISNTIFTACSGVFSSLEMQQQEAVNDANRNMTNLLLPVIPDPDKIVEAAQSDQYRIKKNAKAKEETPVEETKEAKEKPPTESTPATTSDSGSSIKGFFSRKTSIFRKGSEAKVDSPQEESS